MWVETLLTGELATQFYSSDLVFAIYTISVSNKIHKWIKQYQTSAQGTSESWRFSVESLILSVIGSFGGRIVMELVFLGNGLLQSSSLVMNPNKLWIIVLCWILVNATEQARTISDSSVLKLINTWKRCRDMLTSLTMARLWLSDNVDKESKSASGLFGYQFLVYFTFCYLTGFGGATILPYLMRLSSLQLIVPSELVKPSNVWYQVVSWALLLALMNMAITHLAFVTRFVSEEVLFGIATHLPLLSIVVPCLQTLLSELNIHQLINGFKTNPTIGGVSETVSAKGQSSDQPIKKQSKNKKTE